MCIRGWDIRQASKVPAVHLKGFVYFPTSLTQSSSSGAGKLLAAGCKGFNKNGCEIKLFELRGGRGGDSKSPPLLQQQLTGHEHDVTGIQFMQNCRADGKCGGEGGQEMLLSVSRDGYMRRWEGFSRSSGGAVGAEVISKRFLPSNRSSYTCLDSWQGMFMDRNEADEGEGGGYCALGDINGSVHVVDCEGRVVHSTAPGVDVD